MQCISIKILFVCIQGVGVIGSYAFENNVGQAITMNGVGRWLQILLALIEWSGYNLGALDFLLLDFLKLLYVKVIHHIQPMPESQQIWYFECGSARNIVVVF